MYNNNNWMIIALLLWKIPLKALYIMWMQPNATEKKIESLELKSISLYSREREQITNKKT